MRIDPRILASIYGVALAILCILVFEFNPWKSLADTVLVIIGLALLFALQSSYRKWTIKDSTGNEKSIVREYGLYGPIASAATLLLWTALRFWAVE